MGWFYTYIVDQYWRWMVCAYLETEEEYMSAHCLQGEDCGEQRSGAVNV